MKNAFQHLRLQFSFLLMPVFLLALSLINPILHVQSIEIVYLFISLHFFVYPASNAYNSYQDQDTEPIGLIKEPLPANKQVLYASIIFDLIGLVFAYLSGYFGFLFVLIYILSSKAYSWRKIRLKKYPLIGFFTVFIFQGSWILLAVLLTSVEQSVDMESIYWGVLRFIQNNDFKVLLILMMVILVPSFLFGGGYPISQIYQHEDDMKDGVSTISMKLGIIGTFIFSGIMFLIGSIILVIWYYNLNQFQNIAIFVTAQIPVLIYFNYWIYKVIKDRSEANYKHTMRMNIISSTCFNFAFLMILIINLFF